jgi:putative CocE/NonD family hydrolase
MPALTSRTRRSRLTQHWRAVAMAALATSTAGVLAVLAGPATTSSSAATPVLALPASVMSASAAPGHSWTPEAATYGVGITQNVGVTMSDGTVLRADVSYPTTDGVAAAGPFPVLMTQTPYGKSTLGAFSSSTGADSYLVERGYLDVVVDVRGTGDSQGQFGLFDPVQVKDSVQLVHWAAGLPHSDGKVGLYGASYLGINQILTAGSVGKNSPLKAIFPIVSATDLYRDTAFMGGILDLEFGAAYLGLTSGLNVVNPLVTGAKDPSSLAGLSTVEIDHLEDLYNFDTTFIANVLIGGADAYDGAYWQARQPSSVLADVVANGIPAYLIGGEFDLFQRGEPLNYAALQNLYDGRSGSAAMAFGQPVTGRYQLWDGPFTHLGGASIDVDPLELRWFDTWLKGINTGMASTPTPLHYYDLGTNTYDETTTFPFSGLAATRYYLSPTRSGSDPTSLNDGTLTTTPPASSTSAALVWSPVGSPCGSAVDQWGIGPVRYVEQETGISSLPCIQDDRLTQLGPSILNFTTTPFAHGTTLGGPISATVYAKATTKETEWVVEVEDVSPDGQSTPLTEGALLGSLRATSAAQSWTAGDGQYLLPYHPYTQASSQPVVPGAMTRYNIEVFPTLSTIAPGHRIRITITTADSPHLQTTVPETANLVGGVYQVEQGPAGPSSVELPLGTVSQPN